MSRSYHSAPDSVATAPPGCPVNHEFDPLSPAYLENPYPIANDLRGNSPVFFAEAIGHVVVTEMDDIEAIFLDDGVFSSDNVQDPLTPIDAQAAAILSDPDFNPVAVMSNRAEPGHGRIRRHTRQGFHARRLRALEDYMRSRASTYVDAMLAGGSSCEFVSALAFPLPAEIIFRFIGFPDTDDVMVRDWCAERKAFSWGRSSPEDQRRIARDVVSYWKYCRAFVALRNEQREDDFTSELLDAHDADPDDLTYLEVESIIYGLSFAGHDPVTNLLCNMLLCLLPRRDQWQALIDDPSLIPNAVEETLRFESSQIAWRRITTEETTVGGVTLPARTPVMLNLAAANHSPAVFEEPDSFDITRSNARRHISFGKGVHLCLGNGLARMQAKIVLELLTERIPTLTLDPDQELTRFPNVTFRGPESLHVSW